MSDDLSAGLLALPPLQLPEPISYWPQTWPWAIAGLALAVLLARLGWRGWRRYWRGRYRRAALAELQRFSAGLVEPAAGAVAAQLNSLLKRTALAESAAAGRPRSELAALTGSGWWHYLDSGLGADEGRFAELGLRWQAAIYRDERTVLADSEWQHWQSAARHWLKHHRQPAGWQGD